MCSCTVSYCICFVTIDASIFDHVFAHEVATWIAEMEQTCDWKNFTSKLAFEVVQDHRMRADAGRNGGFRYLDLASRPLQRAVNSGLFLKCAL